MNTRKLTINSCKSLAYGLRSAFQPTILSSTTRMWHASNARNSMDTARSMSHLSTPVLQNIVVPQFSFSQPLLKFRQAQSSDEIRKAQQLLHWEFVEQQGWKPTPGNPSDWRIVSPSDQTEELRAPLLSDRYDELSTWFVCVAQHKVVGVCRVVGADARGRTEVEHYTDLPEDVKAMGPLFEINRGVIHPDVRHGPLLLDGMLAMLKLIYAKGGSAICATPEPRIQRALSRLGMTSVKKFQYEPLREHEPQAELFLCPNAAIPVAILHLQAALLARRCRELVKLVLQGWRTPPHATQLQLDQ